jgi:hypothetical protein
MSNYEAMLKIVDREAFLCDIKKDVIATFLTAFSESQDFINVYDESLLSMDIMEFWLEHFSIVRNGGDFYMILKDRERLRLCLYKELCEKVLNKLVDNGVLVMMWDNKKKRIFWKKKELANNTQNV